MIGCIVYACTHIVWHRRLKGLDHSEVECTTCAMRKVMEAESLLNKQEQRDFAYIIAEALADNRLAGLPEPEWNLPCAKYVSKP